MQNGAMKPDPEMLRDIGLNSTNVEAGWAGAANDLARGLNFWTRSVIGRDHSIAVRAALASCKLVVNDYQQDQPGLPPRSYLDNMMSAIGRWLEQPSKERSDEVRSLLDVSRTAHAWNRDTDVESLWIVETIDHASLAVWSGERASYIVATDFATTAARSVTCALHAMLDAGKPEAEAVSAIVDAVLAAAG